MSFGQATVVGGNGSAVQHGTDENLRVEFFLHAVENRFRSRKEGRPVFEDKEYIRILIPGDAKTCYEQPVQEEHKQRFWKQYEHFKSTGRTATEGTPLEQWPQLNVSMVATLKSLNIFTVEQLSTLPDIHLPKLGPGARDLQNRAKAFLEMANDSAAANKMASLEEENTRLKKANEESQARLAKLAERLDALEATPQRKSKVKQ
jgi:hypothetical protein